jgi:hypothetical protein
MHVEKNINGLSGVVASRGVSLSLPFFLQQTIWEMQGGTHRWMDYGDHI